MVVARRARRHGRRNWWMSRMPLGTRSRSARPGRSSGTCSSSSPTTCRSPVFPAAARRRSPALAEHRHPAGEQDRQQGVPGRAGPADQVGQCVDADGNHWCGLFVNQQQLTPSNERYANWVFNDIGDECSLGSGRSGEQRRCPLAHALDPSGTADQHPDHRLLRTPRTRRSWTSCPAQLESGGPPHTRARVTDDALAIRTWST